MSSMFQVLDHKFPFYVITKAAFDHFARNYAAILAPKGIRINNLNPGVTKTAFVTRYGFTEEAVEKIAKDMKIPIGRWGTSEEMEDFLVFMASNKASYMTGQIIMLMADL
uniref:Uncharacterized protein n=1 Tax=Panagrolaimus sp. ES5 TaxID=591445 RepID=A0AC34FF75_9BILA